MGHRREPRDPEIGDRRPQRQSPGRFPTRRAPTICRMSSGLCLRRDRRLARARPWPRGATCFPPPKATERLRLGALRRKAVGLQPRSDMPPKGLSLPRNQPPMLAAGRPRCGRGRDHPPVRIGGPGHLARDETRHGARGVSGGLLRRPTPVAMRDSRRRLNSVTGAATRTPTEDARAASRGAGRAKQVLPVERSSGQL